MSKLELDEIQEISARNGHCDRCGRVIKIYKYHANQPLAQFLYKMADRVEQSGKNIIDLRDIKLPYSTLTQITKLRLHGLVVQARDDDGSKLAHTWLITHKGWAWLNGDPIDEKVVVFDNQVIGHDGKQVLFREVLEGKSKLSNEYEETKVSTPEAGLMHDVRKPKTALALGKFVGHDYSGTLTRNGLYDLEIGALKIGRPVKIRASLLGQYQRDLEYKSIADFHNNWHIVTEGN